MADTTDARTRTDEPRRGGMLRETRDSFAAVFANRNFRRIELAFAGSAIGDWAYTTAVAVWAYGEGGAKALGVWMAIRATLMAVTTPFGAALADKMSRKRLMIIADLIRAVLIAAAAACLFAGTSAIPIYVLATLTALLATPFMCAQRAMLPSLAERPQELTAANGTASSIESLAFFVGPALGALLLGFTTVQVVFLVNVATFLWSMTLVAGVRPPARLDDAGAADPESGAAVASDDGAAEEPGFLSETSAGFRTIAKDRGLLVVTIAAALQTFVAGAFRVFVVVMAAEVLGTGPRGVGFLESVFGVGCIMGGVVALSRASRGQLGVDLAVGVATWSLPLMLVTVWPSPVTCFAAVVLMGLGNPLVDVSLDTIVQRITPDELLGRVFGALETCLIATSALGALAMPFLLDGTELRWALLVVALPVGVAVLLGLPEMRRLDSWLVMPAKVPLLRRIDVFAPLSPAAVESLARGLKEMRFAAGDVLVREGEPSDLFYVIETGRVEVTQTGRLLRHEGPGEYFGEIGLLRDVPRTATISAAEDTVVQTITREDFLSAVNGHREAWQAADRIVTRRLAV